MRADKDSSGVALWVIPVGLAVVSLLLWATA
jgi:cytochrome c-type biogenesis protein CcmH/NrfF